MKTMLLSAVLDILILMLGACCEDPVSVDIEASLEFMLADLAPPEPNLAETIPKKTLTSVTQHPIHHFED